MVGTPAGIEGLLEVFADFVIFDYKIADLVSLAYQRESQSPSNTVDAQAVRINFLST